MFSTIGKQFAVLAILGLMSAAGACRADDQAPQQIPQSQGIQAISPETPCPTYLMEDDDCDCWKCRLKNCCLTKCCLYRQTKIFCNDKCSFHMYIRGYGPAINTRPAGVFWW